MTTRAIVAFGLVLACLVVIGCGGGSSNFQAPPPPTPTPTPLPPTPTPTPAPAVTTVSVSCSSPTVPVTQSNQCSATVQGTGNFNPAVVWSVNNAPGGNGTIGTVSGAGLYTAPATVPTPFTVNVTATSVADASKNSSAPLVVAGTIATVSQPISAATGGTITLPDGSSVTIAAGVLPADQSVTLAEVSFSANQSPNPAITSVGPSLSLSFSTPIELTAAVLGANVPAASWQTANAAVVTSPAIQFSINATNNNVPLLNGSVPVANFIDAANTSSFTGVEGNFNSTTAVVSGSVGFDILSGFKNIALSGLQFAAMNIVKTILPISTAPLMFGVDSQNKPAWGPLIDCPTGKTLVVVHGMNSTVQGAFQVLDPASVAVVNGIQASGAYGSVVGFNYDWTQAIDASGGQLAAFLNGISQCSAVTELDIEAHSEGVAVSMSAIVQLAALAPSARVARLVTVGGPIMGTPAANDPRILLKVFLADKGLRLVATKLSSGLTTLLQYPFVQDLRADLPGQPANQKLADIRASLAALQVQQNGPRIIAVGGTAERLLGQDMSQMAPLIGTSNFDGFIPVASALAFQSGLKVYPLPPVNLGHTELVGNPAVIAAVAKQIIGPPPTPSLTCSTAPCQGTRDTIFSFQGNGFNSSPDTIRIFSLDSTGAFGPLLPSIQDNAGAITWTITPPCSGPAGSFEIFSFDASSQLVSNAVMQTVMSGTCPPPPSAGIISRVAGNVNGAGGFGGDNGLATDATMQTPAGVAFDGAGNMFVADSRNHVIRRIDAMTGIITTAVGTGVAGLSGDGGPASTAQLNSPTHLAFDRAGNLYITDANNHCVRKVILLTGRIATIAGTGVPGFSGDNGPAIGAQLNFPDSITVDGEENVYIADALNNRIRRVDATTGVITTVAGNGIAGFFGDGLPATLASLSFPSRLALDSANNLYVADFQNNRIRKVNAITHFISTFVGSSTAGFSGDGGSVTGAILNGPLSVFIDAKDLIYIADFNNQRIRVVNAGRSAATVAGVTIQPGNIDTIAGNGLTGFTGDDGPAIAAALNGPTGVTVDGAGNLFFGDSNNNVVRRVTLH